jgi:lysophospholipase L1-like esterase
MARQRRLPARRALTRAVRTPAVVIAGLALAAGALSSCSDDDDGGSDDLAGTTSTMTEPRPPGYVALGDSFSSGVGAPPYDAASGDCNHSSLTWPRVLDEQDDVLELLDLPACGGARIEHLLEPWQSRQQPPQIPTGSSDDGPRIPSAEVGLVTLTIGGNDAGFSDLVARCVLGDCSGVPTSGDFRARLETITDRLATEVYPAIRRAFPEARILHVGYPRLTPAAGAERDEPCRWLSPAEQTAAAAIIEHLDDAIEAAVEATDVDDVTFVDTFETFAGHELCSDDPWVNDVISFDGGRAHPTARGYEAMAAAVADVT